MKFLYGPTSLVEPSKSENIPKGSMFEELQLKRNEGEYLQLINEVFPTNPFEFMHERVIFGTFCNADPSLARDVWFSSRNMPITHLSNSSETSFGFIMPLELSTLPRFLLLPPTLLISAISPVQLHTPNRKKDY